MNADGWIGLGGKTKELQYEGGRQQTNGTPTNGCKGNNNLDFFPINTQTQGNK